MATKKKTSKTTAAKKNQRSTKLKIKRWSLKRVVSTVAAVAFIIAFASYGYQALFPSQAAAKMKMGVYVGNGAHVDGFQNMTGHPVQVISNYLDLRYASGTINDYMGNGGVANWLRGDPNRVYLLGVNPLLGEAHNFESGSVETGMRELANAIVPYGVSSQVVIRFGYEMTGDWMPWGELPGYQPNNTGPRYAAMWRRAHTAANAIYPFKWDWCPMIWNNATNAALEEFYPGDQYVDYIGNDTYDAYANGSGDQRWPEVLQRLQNQLSFANLHGKPPVQDEYALWNSSGEQGGGDNPYYITHFLDFTAAHNYAWVVYFNVPDGSVDTTLDQNPNGLNAYKAWWASYDAGGGPAPTPPPPPPTPPASSTSDLVVTDITWTPVSPAPGQAVTFKATIKNQGTGATPTVIHGVSFSVDGTKLNWSDNTTAPLAAGASRTVTANGGEVSATWTAAAGAHTVEAYVDDVNRIAETNENNNKLTKTITPGSVTPPPPPPIAPPVPVVPDLVVTNIDWTPATPAPGQAVTFKATIKNQGTGATPGSVIHGVAFSVDGSKLTWSDTYTGPLAAGASQTVTANGGITSSTWTAVTGTHSIEAWVDDPDRIPGEANESNNKLTKALTPIVTTPPVTNPADTTKPTRPGKPVKTLASQTSLSISWAASTDNVGVTGYHIYRNGTKVASPTTTSFSDSNLTAGTTYSYQASSYDAGGNESDKSDVLSVSTTAATPPPPVTTTPPPNTDQPISITPGGTTIPVSIPANDQPVVTGAIGITNPSSGSNTSKTTLKLNGEAKKTVTGDTVINLDTTTLTNGTHAVTLETTDADGNKTSTSRYVTVDNKLNPLEKLRNFLFKPFAGTWSGRTMNLVFGITTLLVATALIFTVLFLQHRGISGMGGGMVRFG